MSTRLVWNEHKLFLGAVAVGRIQIWETSPRTQSASLWTWGINLPGSTSGNGMEETFEQAVAHAEAVVDGWLDRAGLADTSADRIAEALSSNVQKQ